MLNVPPRNTAPRELRVKIPADLDVKIRVTKLMTGIGLSELVVMALEHYLRDIAREHKRSADTDGPEAFEAAMGLPALGLAPEIRKEKNETHQAVAAT